MAAHSSIPARRIPWSQESVCIAVHVVAQSQTRLKRLSTCDSDGNLCGTLIKSRAPHRVLCLYLYRLSHKPQVADSCMTPYFKWGAETKKGTVLGPKPYSL